ncbi:hypothetical protein KI387_014503, partial [Taxus chinensis]
GRECVSRLSTISSHKTSIKFNSSVYGLKVSCSANPEILSKVQKIVAKHLDVDPKSIKPNSNWNELGIDSMEAAELMLNLEQEFDIYMDPTLVANVTTPEGAADLIHDTKENIKEI